MPYTDDGRNRLPGPKASPRKKPPEPRGDIWRKYPAPTKTKVTTKTTVAPKIKVKPLAAPKRATKTAKVARSTKRTTRKA